MDVKDNNEGSLLNLGLNNKKISSKILMVLFIVFIFLITNSVSYIFGMNFIPMSYATSSQGVERNLQSHSDDTSLYRKMELIKHILYQYYDGEIDNDNLNDEAIRALINALGDPYTSYMDKKQYEDFNMKSKGNYVGIGIQVAPKDGKIVVVSVFDDSPAFEAGIYPGDYIVKVSNEEVDSETIDNAINLIKGLENTDVSIVIERDEEELNFNVTRQVIDLIPVEYEILEDGIGYVKINSFDETSGIKLKASIEDLKSKNVKSIMLDLRGNPGGLLNECVEIASEFLHEGAIIVSTEDKNGNKEILKAGKGSGEDLNIVVLVDGSSASASEVLLGALRDHGRAVSVGSKTFGKGLVQRIFEIGDGTAVKVTISKYYTPSGEFINEVGIVPDHVVEYSQDEYMKDREETKGNKELLRERDPQFKKALEILRGY